MYVAQLHPSTELAYDPKHDQHTNLYRAMQMIYFLD